MKNLKKVLMIVLLAVLFPVIISAQKGSFSAVFSKYEGRQGVESVSISPKMFMNFIIDDNDQKEKELFSKMEALKILSFPKGNSEISKDVFDYISAAGLEEVMSVKEDGETMKMYQNKKELIFIADSDGEYSVIYIAGLIDKVLMKAVMEGEISFN